MVAACQRSGPLRFWKLHGIHAADWGFLFFGRTPAGISRVGPYVHTASGVKRGPRAQARARPVSTAVPYAARRNIILRRLVSNDVLGVYSLT